MKTPPLAETLFGNYRRRALALLLLRPDENFHVREISRLSTAPPGSLHRELKLLTEAGLLSRHTVGDQVHNQVIRMHTQHDHAARHLLETAIRLVPLQHAAYMLGQSQAVVLRMADYQLPYLGHFGSNENASAVFGHVKSIRADERVATAMGLVE